MGVNGCPERVHVCFCVCVRVCVYTQARQIQKRTLSVSKACQLCGTQEPLTKTMTKTQVCVTHIHTHTHKDIHTQHNRQTDRHGCAVIPGRWRQPAFLSISPACGPVTVPANVSITRLQLWVRLLLLCFAASVPVNASITQLRLHTGHGIIRITLKPEWHQASVDFVRRMAEHPELCGSQCQFYRAEPGFLLQVRGTWTACTALRPVFTVHSIWQSRGSYCR